MTIGDALIDNSRSLFGSHIFQPIARLRRRARAHVDGNIGIGADLADKIHELFGAETVGLGNAAPIGVDLHAALYGRPDAVTPMIFIGKTPTRPSHIGHLQRLERGHHIRTDAAQIGDFRILAHPYPAIDSRSQMLGKLSEDIAIDRLTLGAHVDGELSGGEINGCGIGERCRRHGQRRRCGKQHGEHKVASGHIKSPIAITGTPAHAFKTA